MHFFVGKFQLNWFKLNVNDTDSADTEVSLSSIVQ